MPSLFELVPLLTYEFLLAGVCTLAPETAEETYVELSDTEPEDPVGSASTTYPGKGENLCHYFINFCSCLAVDLERIFLILSTLYAMFKTHIAMSPQPSKTLYC